MQIFDVIIFFELRTIQRKTVKPTYLCPLGARKLAETNMHTKCFPHAIMDIGSSGSLWTNQFFLRVLRFSHSSSGMFGTGFLLFLFQGRTLPRAYVYFSCIIFNSVSSPLRSLFLSPPFFLFVLFLFLVLFLTHSNYCVILLTSCPSPFLV